MQTNDLVNRIICTRYKYLKPFNCVQDSDLGVI